MYKKTKSIFLLAVITLSTIAGLFSFQGTASAAPPPLYIDANAKNDTLRAIYRVSMALCLTVQDISHLNGNNVRGSKVSSSDVAEGKMFFQGSSSPEARVGFMVDTGNGVTECRNLLKDGGATARALGWNSNIELACGVGLKRVNNSDCVNGTGDFTDSAIDAKKSRVYANIDAHKPGILGSNQFNNINFYIMAASTYMGTCGGKAEALESEAGPDVKGNTNKYHLVSTVDSKGNISKVYYTRTNNSGKDFRNYEDSFQWVQESCGWMQDRMNEYAGAYAAWVKQNQPGMGNNPGTCDEKYGQSKLEVDACADGFAHKNEKEYCLKYPANIPQPTQYNACLYGQQTATAATGTTTPPADAGTGASSGAKSTCAIQGIGWIICPVVNFMAKVVDAAYGFVASLLTVQPLLTTGSTEGVYNAWSIMRNFANIAFVIAFLMIIFSQLTSVGITNYGIKKMLPRLIIAAILVNASYWVCAIAVDLSNIVGSSINDVLKGIGDSGQIAGPNASDFGATSGAWTGIAGGLLAGTLIAVTALYIGLAALLPALIAALLAIVTVFLVLTIRQALIILLIVISPLAFVAYLLPNTESLFKKWKDLLKTLLLMYPIIAGLFGASHLASVIIMAGASANNGPYKIAIQIMGAAVSIIPLALTPIVMKSAGGVLNRIGGIVNNPNKGPFDRMRKGAEGYAANRKEFRQLKTMNGGRTMPFKRGFQQRSVERNAVLNNRKAELNRASSSYLATKAETDDAFRARLAAGGGEGADRRALASAITVQADLDAKEVKAASAVIEHLNLSSGELNALAGGGSAQGMSGADSATRKAAIMSAVAKGTVDDVETIIKSAGTMSAGQRAILSESIAKSSIPTKATHLGGQTLNDIAQGNVTNEADLNSVMARAIKKGKYAPEKLAQNDPASLKRMENLLNNPGSADLSSTRMGDQTLSAADVNQVSAIAHELAGNDRLYGTTSGSQRPVIDQLRAHTPPPPPRTPPGPGTP